MGKKSEIGKFETDAGNIQFTNISNLKEIQRLQDITESKRTEVALKESENKYRELVENSPDAIVIYVEGKIVFANNECLHMMAASNIDELIGKPVLQFVHPDYLSIVMERMNIIAKTGIIMPLTEEKILRLDGTQVDVEVKAIPVTLENKFAVQLIIRDITVRKKVEESLSKKQRQLADIIEFLPDATLAVNNEKKIIIWNKAIEEMTGISAADMIGKGNHSYSVPFFGEAKPQLMDLIFEDQKDIELLYPYILRKGEAMEAEFFCNALYNNKGAWIFAKTSPLHDEAGNIIGAIEILRDITDHKKAEDELNKQKYFFEQMFMQSSISTQILDSEGWCKRINPKLNEIFGVEPKNIEGNIYNIFKDEAVKQGGVIPFLEKVFYKGETAEWEVFFDIGLAADSQNIEVKGKLKEWFYNWAYPIFDENGKISNVIIQHNKISERKLVEETLQKNKRELSTLMNNLPGMVYSCLYDKNRTIDFVSEGSFELTGYLPEDLIGNKNISYFEIIHPEDRKMISDTIRDAINKKIAYATEYRIVTKRGFVKHVWERGQGIFESDNTFCHLEGFITDISKRKQTEEALKESEERYRSILNASPDAITITNSEHFILMVSPGAVKMFGYNNENEIIGRLIKDIILPNDWENAFSNFMLTFKGEISGPIEYRGLRADGSSFDIEVNTEVIWVAKGQSGQMVSIIRDISERKQAESALKEKMDDLQRFHNLTVGRELTMIDLKKEVNALLKKSGKPEKYKIVESITIL